jgi:hypothetical protein
MMPFSIVTSRGLGSALRGSRKPRVGLTRVESSDATMNDARGMGGAYPVAEIFSLPQIGRMDPFTCAHYPGSHPKGLWLGEF